MAVLLAALLAVIGAAGMWNNPLFTWASSLVPWMAIPGQVLSILLWFGFIVLYVFPDARFTPRWTIWLAVALVPLVIFLVFDLNFILNPDTWPGPLSLLPNLIFIGTAFFSLIYRYVHTPDPVRKAQFKGYVLGVSLLLTLYFLLFMVNDIYGTLVGQELIQGTRATVIYVLISEPLWYALELVFAMGVAQSIIRKGLLESKGGAKVA